MTIKLYDINYEITAITAIASCDDGAEDCRQDALLVIANNGAEKTEHVVFGWKMPADEEGFEDMCDDSGAWEPRESNHKIRGGGLI